MIDTIAMSVAARAVGFHAVAEIIERDNLSPEGVARLFRLSARFDRKRAAAIVILAGTVARYSADPSHWQDRGERELALSLIERFRFAEIDRLAVQLVRRHWGEISAPVTSETPRLTSRSAGRPRPSSEPRPRASARHVCPLPS
jgi:hypothetical protein